MQDLIISINKNILKISTVDKEAILNTASIELPSEVVDSTRVINPSGFAGILDNIIPQVTSLGKNKLGLNFIMEPEDVFLRYVTVSKNGSDISDQILAEIKEKNPEINLENLYFSYKKMAPFVYQFVAVRKDVLENYLEISNVSSIELRSVIPWVLGLPKYENVNDPAIFVCKIGSTQVVALSELNGVFFAGSYSKEKTSEELESLVKDLSFYKRSTPIKCIYTLNYDSFSMSDYETRQIKCPEFNSSDPVPEGFELNTIINFLLDSDPELVNNQINVLNLLPLPVVQSKRSVAVIAGSVVGALLLVVGIYFGVTSLGSREGVSVDQLAQENTQETSQVLSESSENADQELSPDTSETDQNNPNLEVKKANLKIKVMNGAGIGGIAGKTKDFLNELGYTALVATNADSKVESTILDFKPSMIGDYESIVVEDLKESFPQVEVKQDLSEDGDYDLIITVGISSEL